MKKILSALLLVGLLTSSFISCTETKPNETESSDADKSSVSESVEGTESNTETKNESAKETESETEKITESEKETEAETETETETETEEKTESAKDTEKETVMTETESVAPETEKQTEAATETSTSAPETTVVEEKIQTFKNPIKDVLNVKYTWSSYAVGDPFVMRFNGRYYLYSSTKDGMIGIKCWSSDNLIDWKYEGLCVKDKISNSAYAPEVFYYNGKFYLYTSPGGSGHYIYESTNPTSGFEKVTDNIGRSIDGSVLIDQKGKWYFMTADGQGIVYYNMTSPTKVTGSAGYVGAYMNGWTEGPMSVYHDGTYFLTYTGNHVWSNAYRINYAYSESNSLKYKVHEGDNPILVSVNNKVKGIGHSSTVKGPNLDAYYIVYHSWGQGLPIRNMRVDRIYFNGTTMSVAGPLSCNQQYPQMPDIYSHFTSADSLAQFVAEGSATASKGLTLTASSKILTTETLESDKNFTLELTTSSVLNGGKAGAVFNYIDAGNYGEALLNPDKQTLELVLFENGVKTEKSFDFVKSFKKNYDFSVVQTMQVERNGKNLVFYLNDIKLGEAESNLSGGKFGCTAVGKDAQFGYFGITDEFGGSSASEQYKNVSSDGGTFYAIYCTEKNAETVKVGGLNSLSAKEGESYTYRILAEKDGTYTTAVNYKVKSDSVIEFYLDGVKLDGSELTLKSGSSIAVGKLNLKKGQHELKVTVKSGTPTLVSYTILLDKEVKETTYKFKKSNDGMYYTEGNWEFKDGTIILDDSLKMARRVYGDENWADYTVEIDITRTSGRNAGVMVRSSNVGVSYAGSTNPVPEAKHITESINWFQGYYIGISQKSVILQKMNYSAETLAEEKGTFNTNAVQKLKVECKGNNIKVYVNGELKINYTDNDSPWLQGRVGIRSDKAAVKYANFKVIPLD